MKKTTTIILLALLAMTFQAATVQKDEEMNRKLRGAIIMGRTDEVKELIKAGVDVNRKFDIGENRDITPLFCVCAIGSANQAEIGKLLIDAGAKVNEKFQGATLLHITATFAGNKALTELLIANGLDVNAKIISSSETQGSTPLHLAALNGKKAVAELLINKGADVNAKSETGVTPLDLATEKGKKELVDLLRKHGGVSGKSGTTMLFSAAREFPFWSR
jgi:ankyrin repeat protein